MSGLKEMHPVSEPEIVPRVHQHPGHERRAEPAVVAGLRLCEFACLIDSQYVFQFIGQEHVVVDFVVPRAGKQPADRRTFADERIFVPRDRIILTHPRVRVENRQHRSSRRYRVIPVHATDFLNEILRRRDIRAPRRDSYAQESAMVIDLKTKRFQNTSHLRFTDLDS